MSLAGLFDMIRVINLPNRIDRHRETALELRRLGLDLAPGSVEVFPAIRPSSADGFPTIGSRGCFLSHLEVLREALRNGAKRLLVLEDDVTFDSTFCNRQDQILAVCGAATWHLLWLGHEDTIADTSRDFTLRSGEKSLMTTSLYAVEGSIMQRLVASFDAMLTRPAGHPDGGPMHVDGAFNTFCRQNPDVVRLMVTPSIARQRRSRSDIAPNRWYDRLALTRKLAEVARRRLKHDISIQ